MRVPYCRKSDYEALYGSYLKSSPHTLLDAAGVPPDGWKGLQVLDLCGGNGRLSLAAKRMGAEVTMVEADPEMCDSLELRSRGIDGWFNKVEDVLLAFAGHRFDAVFCQQAANYWLNNGTAEDVARVLAPDGVFVFNTFNTLPSTVPTFRERDMGDHYEYEALHSVRGIVHHVQLREGYAPHMTSFKWIPPDEFDRILAPHFEVERRTDGRTDIYVCRTKERTCP
jgi:SAM-dependent methyltransferase